MAGGGKNVYGLAADLVLISHTLFALFAVLGAPVLLLDPLLIALHIPVVLWSSLVNLAHWTCPLTPLEQQLRQKASQDSFTESWTRHYLESVVRPLGMPRHMELIAGFSVLVWNLLVYGAFWVYFWLR